MSMRINWFSPLPPEKTDIAHYTARCATALQREFDVVYWTPKAYDIHIMPKGTKVQHYDADTIASPVIRKKLFDGINLYNMGNDVRYHSSIYRTLKKVPGIIILHDAKLHHFIRGFYSDDKDYIDIARKHYDENGAIIAEDIAGQRQTIDQHVDTMPFIEDVLENSIGVICHSKDVRFQISSFKEIPILNLPLPFKSLAARAKSSRIWGPPFRLIMFGFLGSNRRLESILLALAKFSHRDCFRLDIFGTVWDEFHILTMIKKLGLQRIVYLHGYVAEDELDDAIASSHLSFNLRFPTMGEASGSVLRSWNCATPTLVTAEAWYKSLPNSVAYKITVDNEIEDIQAALTLLIRNPHLFERYGMTGYAYARANHDPDQYVIRLKSALENVKDLELRFGANVMIRAISSKVSFHPILLNNAVDNVASVLGR